MYDRNLCITYGFRDDTIDNTRIGVCSPVQAIGITQLRKINMPLDAALKHTTLSIVLH